MKNYFFGLLVLTSVHTNAFAEVFCAASCHYDATGGGTFRTKVVSGSGETVKEAYEEMKQKCVKRRPWDVLYTSGSSKNRAFKLTDACMSSDSN